eukprot:g34301.t1
MQVYQSWQQTKEQQQQQAGSKIEEHTGQGEDTGTELCQMSEKDLRAAGVGHQPLLMAVKVKATLNISVTGSFQGLMGRGSIVICDHHYQFLEVCTCSCGSCYRSNSLEQSHVPGVFVGPGAL